MPVNALSEVAGLESALAGKAPTNLGLTLTGNSLKAIRVNAGETAFELATISGGSAYTVQNRTAGYTETATSGEHLVKCDLAAGFTVTLPTAVGNTAKFHFKKMLSAGSIVLDGAGTETIDGAATATLTAQYESISLMSDNANWIVV